MLNVCISRCRWRRGRRSRRCCCCCCCSLNGTFVYSPIHHYRRRTNSTNIRMIRIADREVAETDKWRVSATGERKKARNRKRSTVDARQTKIVSTYNVYSIFQFHICYFASANEFDCLPVCLFAIENCSIIECASSHRNAQKAARRRKKRKEFFKIKCKTKRHPIADSVAAAAGE